MATILAIDLLVVLLVAILWTSAMDREDARRARRRAGLPTIGHDELVPRAVAIPAAYRRRMPRC